jgi:hypothetical protein
MKSVHRAFRLSVLCGLAVLVSPSPAQSHSGGLDSCGCHAGSRPYHCHRNPCNHCPGSFDCPGNIKIVSIPKARVWINGEYAGVSPTNIVRASHGRVEVRLEHSVLGEYKTTASVEYGRTTVVSVRW